MNQYKCEHHTLNVICLNCVFVQNQKYNKLLEFVKKHSAFPDPHTWENDISGWHREIIIDGQELLKEIGVTE